MASLDTLFLCSVGQQAWLFSWLALNFFCQNQGFCSYEIVFTKKRAYFKLISIADVQNL